MVTTSLFSVSAAITALTKSAEDAEAATNTALEEQGTSTGQVKWKSEGRCRVKGSLFRLDHKFNGCNVEYASKLTVEQ